MLHRHAAIVLAAAIAVALAVSVRFVAVAAAPTIDLDRASLTVPRTDFQGAFPAVTLSAEVLDDGDAARSIDDVARFDPDTAPFHRLTPNEGADVPYVGAWLRVSLLTRERDGEWVLFFPLEYDDVDVYVRDERGGYALSRIGMRVPLRARPFQRVPYPALPLSAAFADGRPIYIHLMRHGPLPIAAFAARQTAMLAADRDGSIPYLMLLGVFGALAVSNALLFLYLREPAFGEYAVVLVAALLITVNALGRLSAWLFPWTSLPVLPSSQVLAGAGILALAFFARSFLGLGRRAPVLDRVVLGLAAAASIWYVLLGFEPWSIPPLIAGTMGIAANLGLLCTLLAAGIIMLRRGVAAARFYVAGFAALAGGIVIELALSLSPAAKQWYAQVPWLPNPVLLGFVWDALFLTFAIADRIRTSQAEAFAALAARELALKALAESQEATVERLSVLAHSMERFVPHAFLQHLEKASVEELELGDHTIRDMALLFSDIRSFTTLAEAMTAQETFDYLNAYLNHVGPIVREHGGFIDKYIGDAIMALFPDSPATALDAAIALQTAVTRYNLGLTRDGHAPIAVGVGLHCGTLALGTIGERERIETTVIADAVNIAARMEGLTKLFGAKIIVSRALVDRLPDRERYRLRSLGRVRVVGAVHDVEIFEAFDADLPDMIVQKLRSRDAFGAALEAFAQGLFERAEAGFARVVADAPHDRPAAYFMARCHVLTTLAIPEAWDGVEHLETK